MSTAALVLTLLLIPSWAQDSQVDNPEYLQWAGFKPGSWVTFEQPCGKGALLQETTKLLERTPEKAVFECTKVEAGFKYPLFQKVTPSRLAVREPSGAVARSPEGGEIEFQGPGGRMKSVWRKTAEGDEEIDLAGKKLKCHWIKIEFRTESAIESINDKSSTKTWYSKEIPGNVAKIEMTRWIKDDPPHDLVVVRAAKQWRVE